MSESAVGEASGEEKTPEAGPPTGSHICVLCDNVLPTKQALQVIIGSNYVRRDYIRMKNSYI